MRLRASKRKYGPLLSGFSLLEMLVAMAVLSIMMAFMFNALGQSLKVWDSGSRQIEAAQAARIGLDRMARDLRYAVAQRAFYELGTNTTTVITNIVPFFSTNSGSQPSAIPAESMNNLIVPPQSGMIFATVPLAHPLSLNSPFAETGFISAFCRISSSSQWGWGSLPPEKYFLLYHSPLLVMTNTHVRDYGFLESRVEAYLRNTQGTGWLTNTSDRVQDHNRLALVDNCYQMNLQFATNTPAGLRFTNRWTNQDALPAGVLVTLRVMDSKTAERIAQLKGTNVFTAQELSDDDGSVVSRVRREGTVQVSRFIPFLSSTN
jgi:prepilin-type N-terminal cleavage/methylation domain-containing protein